MEGKGPTVPWCCREAGPTAKGEDFVIHPDDAACVTSGNFVKKEETGRQPLGRAHEYSIVQGVGTLEGNSEIGWYIVRGQGCRVVSLKRVPSGVIIKRAVASHGSSR